MNSAPMIDRFFNAWIMLFLASGAGLIPEIVVVERRGGHEQDQQDRENRAPKFSAIIRPQIISNAPAAIASICGIGIPVRVSSCEV